MRLCAFEDAGVQFLEPLSLTRPAFTLWCGAGSILERQRRLLGAHEVGALVRPGLVPMCRLQYPELAVNDADFLHSDSLVLVNGRWLPPEQVPVGLREPLQPHVGLVGKEVAYVALPVNGAEHFPETIETWLSQCRQTLPSVEAGGTLVRYLWELVDANGPALTSDWRWFQERHGNNSARHGAAVLGREEQLVVAQGATIEPYVVVDTRGGPVLIDEGAVIHSFSRLEGPCYVGRETWIVGAKLRGGTIGPVCRIGGEVETSIVHGHSNKYHDGFLGHSYIGEWVNLAAGTQTSDLRNDYGQVRVTVAGERVRTGRTKVGSFIGDHTKTGLGALLNTGTLIGAFCNVLPSGTYLPQTIPSFCVVQNGKIQERLDFRPMFTTASLVMRRRGCEFTDLHRDFVYWLYDQTAEQRHRTFREVEVPRLRR